MQLQGITPEQWRIVWGYVRAQLMGTSGGIVPNVPNYFDAIQFRNTTAEEVPPFGVMRIVTPGVEMRDDMAVVTIAKPNTSGDPVLVNGPQAIPAGGYGSGYKYGILQVKAEASLTLGQSCRAKNASWEIEDGEGPFVFIGYDTQLNCGIARIGGGGGGSGGGEHGVIIKTPAGGIAARSGTTVSSASCDVFSIVGTTLTDTGNNIDVFNISISSVGASKYGLAKKEYATGKWVIDFEDCS
jgi:hypothetical protein